MSLLTWQKYLLDNLRWINSKKLLLEFPHTSSLIEIWVSRLLIISLLSVSFSTTILNGYIHFVRQTNVSVKEREKNPSNHWRKKKKPPKYINCDGGSQTSHDPTSRSIWRGETKRSCLSKAEEKTTCGVSLSRIVPCQNLDLGQNERLIGCFSRIDCPCSLASNETMAVFPRHNMLDHIYISIVPRFSSEND